MLALALRVAASAYVVFLSIELGSRPLVVSSLDLKQDNLFIAVIAVAGHFLAMMILGCLVTAAWPQLSNHRLCALLLSYAILMELLHLLLPTRSFELIDLGQNIAGVLTGILITKAMINWIHQRSVAQSQ